MMRKMKYYYYNWVYQFKFQLRGVIVRDSDPRVFSSVVFEGVGRSVVYSGMFSFQVPNNSS